MNDMSKCDSSVRSGLEFKSTKLAWMDEVIGCNSELNSFSDHFFNELSKSVEKYDWAKYFWIIVRWLAWFGDNDCSGYLEIFRLVA